MHVNTFMGPDHFGTGNMSITPSGYAYKLERDSLFNEVSNGALNSTIVCNHAL